MFSKYQTPPRGFLFKPLTTCINDDIKKFVAENGNIIDNAYGAALQSLKIFYNEHRAEEAAKDQFAYETFYSTLNKEKARRFLMTLPESSFRTPPMRLVRAFLNHPAATKFYDFIEDLFIDYGEKNGLIKLSPASEDKSEDKNDDKNPRTPTLTSAPTPKKKLTPPKLS